MISFFQVFILLPPSQLQLVSLITHRTTNWCWIKFSIIKKRSYVYNSDVSIFIPLQSQKSPEMLYDQLSLTPIFFLSHCCNQCHCHSQNDRLMLNAIFGLSEELGRCRLLRSTTLIENLLVGIFDPPLHALADRFPRSDTARLAPTSPCLPIKLSYFN